MFRFLLVFFVFLSLSSIGQNKPGFHEMVWCFAHPFQVIKAKKITNYVLLTVDSCLKNKQLDAYNYGGKLDAFRHGYWMAMLSKEMPAKKALKLGVAHEKKNRKDFKKGKFETQAVPDSASIAMDLLNNKIGADIAITNKKITNFELKLLIIDKINKGDFFILKRDDQGNFVDVNGKIISTAQQKEKFSNGKYLVKSNIP